MYVCGLFAQMIESANLWFMNFKTKRNIFILPIILMIIAVGVIYFITRKKDRLDIRVDEKEFKPTIIRLDERIYHMHEDQFEKFADSLRRADPNFFEGWTYQLIYSQYPRFPQRLLMDSLKHLFFHNYYMRKFMDEVHTKFGDIKKLDQVGASVYGYYKHYFPNANLPKLITTVNCMRAPGGIFEKSICFSLDYFMGGDYPAYVAMRNLNKYEYRNYAPEYFGRRIAEALYENIYPSEEFGSNFMKELILRGAKEYFIDAMIPKDEDSVKRLYTSVQLKWLAENEKQIWEHFASNKLFYSDDKEKVARYFVDGPFTQGLPNESAPRLGSWVGYKIVKNYMDKHPEVSLEMLMREKNYNKIFTESGYKP